MENYAKKIAVNYKIQKRSNPKTFPIEKLEDDFKFIEKTYDILNESISLNVEIPPSGEWLLDNYYLIEEQVNSIKREITIDDYKSLPAINGTSRILIISRALVNYTDANITEENIKIFIKAYQSKKIISMKELWIMPTMLKIAIIEYIKNICEKILDSQLQKFKVESLVERIVNGKNISNQLFSKYKNIRIDTEATSYVEHLTYSLRKLGKEGKKYLEVLEEEVKKVGTTTNDIIKVEHYDIALRRVSMGNSITSMRNVIRYNWEAIFENINSIEDILLKDKWYVNLDYDTRNEYRNEIQKLSKKTEISERYIASKLIELAGEEHIGEYLIGDSKEKLYEKIGYKYKKDKNKFLKYLISIYLPTIVFSILIAKKNFLLAIIPISEVFVMLVNKIVSKNVAPKRLSRIENISDDVSTFVIVPTLLNNAERVRQMMKKLEVYYLGNKMDNLFFALLGDASESNKEKMEYDDEIIKVGKEEADKLNKKYGKDIFFFLYRKRVYNSSQEKWLGYERKRGMISEFNKFLLFGEQGTFIVNTINIKKEIKYVITLDADTELVMDSAKKLVGIMEHPLNKPVIRNGIVVKGYGIVQPKVGISIKASTASLFSKIFGGSGGIDIYSTAESNVYQDLFGEAIFTGKGIYNVRIFNEILKNEIPENTVLSHDLLEGSYIRCGLASDIEIIDGFPSRLNSYMVRLVRWTRGDWQILKWLFKGPLNNLSRYKIFDNLRRSLVPIFALALMFFENIVLGLIVIFSPLLIDIIFSLKIKKCIKNKKYLPIISGIKGSAYRCMVELMILPYKAVLMIEAIVVTLYRMFISKKHLLEWITADDAEKMLGKDLKTFMREMTINPLIGIALVLASIIFFPQKSMLALVLLMIWSISSMISFGMSLPEEKNIVMCKKDDKEYLLQIAKSTWSFFEKYMNVENNFLPPDNYQEKRKNEITELTSSTNIGLALLVIMSAKDLNFINDEKEKELINNIITTIEKLEKWNGHLYNWYNIKTLEPLNPRFVSTVDSGNFVGYLYTLKGMMIKNNWSEKFISRVDSLIGQTNFNKLYDSGKSLFSVGYDFKENVLVDSYYDLLASEARGASLVAVAKRDVPYKHWFCLGRTLTSLDGRKGLISWAGTMFEYFMPYVITPNFEYTLMDETYEFCIYSQKKYAQKLNIPWGISEAAFNLQDLNYNYQYKAFGIPWLGVKRGLKNEIVVSPYSSIMTISKDVKGVIENLKRLENVGAFGKYGFYDAVDYTPGRTGKNGCAVVKTYMAHHQGLILSSINNFLNKNVLIDRFNENPEIQSVQILMQEKVPENVVFTKVKKEKVKVLKYKDYEEYMEKRLSKEENTLNILSNDKYTLVINNNGEGYSKYKNINLTRYKYFEKQGTTIYIKNEDSGEAWSNTLRPINKKPDDYAVTFSSAECKFYRKDGSIETTTRVTISPEENAEIRQVEIKSISPNDVHITVYSYEEPIICSRDTDINSPAFNKLFLNPTTYENACIIEKRCRNRNEIKLYYMYNAYDTSENENQFEIEIDKSKIIGEGRNMTNPKILDENIEYGCSVNTVPDLAISCKKEYVIKPEESIKINFLCAVSDKREELERIYEKYKLNENVERIYDLSISRSLVENRFWGYTAKNINLYNKIYYEILNESKTLKKYEKYIRENKLLQKDLWKFGISGDIPIILVKIKNPNEIELVADLVSAIEYYSRKNIKVDLVIIDEEKNKYEQYTYERIYEVINNKGLNYLLDIDGGIHIIKLNNINSDEINLLYSCSDIILDAQYDLLEEEFDDRKTDAI